MELSEFRRRYDDSENRFRNRLQAISTAIEIVVANNPQNLHTIKQTIQIISEYFPQMLTDYSDLTELVEEFCSSQQSWNPPPLSLAAAKSENQVEPSISSLV